MTRKLEKNKPHQLYFTRDGIGPLPGASGIANVAEDSGGLVSWANREGLKGKDCRVERDAAADSGTIAHGLSEAYLLGDELDLSDWSEESIALGKIAFEKFRAWWEKSEFEFMHAELQLVSHEHLFGGTLDILARKKDKICLIDLKTNKKLRASHAIQAAGYLILVNENFPDDTVDEVCLLRLPKTSGRVEPLWLDPENFPLYQKAFLANLMARHSREALEMGLPDALKKWRPRLKAA